MNRWCIALVLCAALLLVGAAGAVKPAKEPVDKIVFVHYKDPNGGSPPATDPGTSFKLMGVKWNSSKFPVTYYVDTSNSGLVASAVTTEFRAAFKTWDDASQRVAFSYGGSKAPAATDGYNDVYFAPLSDANVIAVTTVWYNRATKEIVEADLQMNSKMTWGIDADGEGSLFTLANAYDVRNIATHEIGHVCGLADLYGPRDGSLTMYGYGGLGEVKKDSLAAGDIAGLVKIYGS